MFKIAYRYMQKELQYIYRTQFIIYFFRMYTKTPDNIILI